MMARARSPNRDKAKELWLQSGKKRLLKDIAAELGVSETQVRKWKNQDAWEGHKAKVTLPKEKGLGKGNVTKKSGPPKGNKNAAGHGGTGPPGNKNAEKHGGYSTIFFDTLEADEHEMVSGMDFDGEQLLLDEIALLTVRERRIMQSINKYRNAKGGQAVARIARFEDKREFDSPEDKELYEERQREKIENGDKLPGRSVRLSTETEATYDIVQRLEEALTRCQAQKQRCIDSLNRLREQNGGGSDLVDDWVSAVMEADSDEAEG